MRAFLILAVLTTFCAPAARAQTTQMALAEALQRALRVQPAVVQAQGNVTTAAWQKRAAIGAFLPTLTLSSSAFRLNQQAVANGFPVQSGTYQYNSSLSTSLDLFTGFRRVARWKNADATGRAADAALVNQRYQVTVATQQAFYTALADEDLVRVAEAQVQRAKEELQISVNKFLAGAATRSDTLTSTVDHGSAQLTLLEARANLATAQANLARQTGVDGPVRAVADSLLPALPDTTGLRAATLAGAPAAVQADAQERAASASLWDARSQYFPAITASYSTSSQGLTQPWQGFDAGNRNLNQLRIGLSWTLFNGFAREQATAQSAASLDFARAEAADTRRQLNAQFTQQVAGLFTAHTQITIAGANVDAAAEALRVQQERYRLGAATLLDLLTAEANLTQAETSQVQARYNYLISRAQLEALVGHSL